METPSEFFRVSPPPHSPNVSDVPNPGSGDGILFRTPGVGRDEGRRPSPRRRPTPDRRSSPTSPLVPDTRLDVRRHPWRGR